MLQLFRNCAAPFCGVRPASICIMARLVVFCLPETIVLAAVAELSRSVARTHTAWRQGFVVIAPCLPVAAIRAL